MTASRPRWIRLDVDFGDNPKIMQLRHQQRHDAIALWVESLTYATRHLTDGWIPQPWPRQVGYRVTAVAALVSVDLWHCVEITDAGGWLINDFGQYQLSRQAWQAKSDRQRANAAKRWG